MSYDFYLGVPQKRYEIHILVLKEKLHDHLFINNKDFFKDGSRLSRLSDPYKDAVFFSSDITVILNEINDILMVSKDVKVNKFCHDFKKVCERALKEQKNIYCAGD